jgi:hypothetical protein
MQTGLKTCAPQSGFYIALPILHGLGAIAAAIICFYCNVEKMNLQAKTPVQITITPGFDTNTLNKFYLAGYPWSEDADFKTHRWNPIVLIMLFQWLTTAFAIPNIEPLLPRGVAGTLCLTWLAAGYSVFIVWTLAEMNYFCVAMFLTGTVSFWATAFLCYLAMEPPHLCPVAKDDEDVEDDTYGTNERRLTAANVGGRKWYCTHTRNKRHVCLGVLFTENVSCQGGSQYGQVPQVGK